MKSCIDIKKAKVDWIRDGDRYTFFFHVNTIVKNWRTHITAIKNEDGIWLNDKDELKSYIVHYFSNLFTEDGEENLHNIPQDIFPELFIRIELLCLSPIVASKWMFVQSIGSLKAPRPDWYQALFFQKNWDLVKNSVYKVVFKC